MCQEIITLNIKETSWKLIVTFLLVSLTMVSLINLVLFPSDLSPPISRATGNLIDATLQANLLNIAVFSTFFFVSGKLRPVDVGLRWHKLLQGIPLTVLLWACMQAIIPRHLTRHAGWVQRN